VNIQTAISAARAAACRDR